MPRAKSSRLAPETNSTQVDDEDSDEEPRHPRQRRNNDESAEEEEGSEHGAVDAEASAEDQLAKKLVRYALACEFSRTPIRRDGIKERGTEIRWACSTVNITDGRFSAWRPG